MQYLAGMGFDMMSLTNDHAWDLGECGIRQTIVAAEENGVVTAGTGTTMAAPHAPAYLEVGRITVALVASTTSRDERESLLDNVKERPGLHSSSGPVGVSVPCGCKDTRRITRTTCTPNSSVSM